MLSKVVLLGEYDEERSTGEKIKYVVQTAPPEMAEEIVDHLTKVFLPREPISKTLLITDPESTRNMQDLWREAITIGTTLVALQTVEGQKPKLIGVNVTPITYKTKKESAVFHGENFNCVHRALIDVARRAALFDKYGVDRFMTGLGFSVDPQYHGYRVGQRILEARRPLCKQLGIKATATVFTSSTSQHIAAKVGFEVLAELDYSTYTEDGKNPLIDVPEKMLMMGMKF